MYNITEIILPMMDYDKDEQSIMDYITEIEMIYSAQYDNINDDDDRYKDDDIYEINRDTNTNTNSDLSLNNSDANRRGDTFYDLIRMYGEQNSNQYRNFYSIDNDILRTTTDTMLSQVEDALENEVLNQTLQTSIEQTQPVEKRILSNKGRLSIKSFSFHYGTKYNGITCSQCPISLESFKENDTISKLPCGHEFIKDNIMHWLETESVKCPVCRYELDYDCVFIRSDD